MISHAAFDLLQVGLLFVVDRFNRDLPWPVSQPHEATFSFGCRTRPDSQRGALGAFFNRRSIHVDDGRAPPQSGDPVVDHRLAPVERQRVHHVIARLVERRDAAAACEDVGVFAVVRLDLFVRWPGHRESLLEVSAQPKVGAQCFAQVGLLDAVTGQRVVKGLVRGKSLAHGLQLAVHRRACRFGGRVALDFAEHQRAIDQLREHGTRHIRSRGAWHQSKFERRHHVALHDQVASHDGEHPIDDLVATRGISVCRLAGTGVNRQGGCEHQRNAIRTGHVERARASPP